MFESITNTDSLTSQITALQQEVKALRETRTQTRTQSRVARRRERLDRPVKDDPKTRTRRMPGRRELGPGRRELGPCRHCGEYRHFSSVCRFKNVQCFNCLSFGHIKAVCRATSSGKNPYDNA